MAKSAIHRRENDPADVVMGRRVAYWRKRRKLTLVQLAEKWGLSKSTVGRIESGQQTLRPGMIDRLLVVLDMSIGRFYRGGENDEAAKGREVAA